MKKQKKVSLEEMKKAINWKSSNGQITIGIAKGLAEALIQIRYEELAATGVDPGNTALLRKCIFFMKNHSEK